ncbi:hypothetical protein [Halovivax sp.]|uniref:hypothetical protein n=1 Tax=Halovivax sp. TaxID=1935978 RepID=UPI0025BD832F|nr:hypothetical protein [Halovivax sp.]
MGSLVTPDRLVEENPAGLQRSLERLVSGDRGTGSGETLPIAVDAAEVERARRALNRLATADEAPAAVERAATRLEIALEAPLSWLEGRRRRLTIALDLTDAAVLALALVRSSRRAGTDESAPVTVPADDAGRGTASAIE